MAEVGSNLSIELRNWAVDRMQFIPHGLFTGSKTPAPDDFKFVCRGQMADVWKFVIEHVYSAQTVRTIRGNLLLKAKQAKKQGTYHVEYKSERHFSAERAALEEARRRLSGELTSIRTNIYHVERDLDRVRRETAATERSCLVAHGGLNDVRRKTALLTTHSRHIHEETEKFEELATRVRHRSQLIETLQQKSLQPLVMLARHGQALNEEGMETVCLKDVRDACEVIGSFLSRLLQGTLHGDKKQQDKRKSELWQRVESVLRDYSADQVLTALAIYTQDTTTSVRQNTLAIDVRNDAEKLRFKYESEGRLADMSSPPSIIQSVHQLLEESQAATMARYLETERCRNHSHKLQQRLSTATSILDDLLHRRHRDNPGALQLARSLVETETQVSCSRAVLRRLEALSAQLRQNIDHASSEKLKLFTKYQKIQDFRKIAEKKQNLIRVLIKQILSSRSRLEAQQNEIVEYAERALRGYGVKTQSLTRQLGNCVIREVDAFARLPLPLMLVVKLDSGYKVAVLDLSIQKLSGNPLTPGAQTLARILQTLEFPTYGAPEDLLPKVLRLQNEMLDSTLSLAHRDNQSPRSDENVRRIVQHIADVCAKVGENDRCQMEKILPVLQRRLGQATDALTGCLQIKDLVVDWWEQPGQASAPWVVVDGLTLQQWRDKWTVATTHLRQQPFR